MLGERNSAANALGSFGCGVALVLCSVFMLAGNAGAAWAFHGIIDETNLSARYPISVRLSDDKTKVRIFLPERVGDAQGYFLITAKKRLARNELEFRMSMSRWKSHSESVEKGLDYRSRTEARWREFYADVDRFEEMRLLKRESREGAWGAFVELDRETALRSYIFYDFLPWGGSGIRDGGLWLTYDLPSLVEAMSAKRKAGKSLQAGQVFFRVKDVVIQEGSDGGKSFRVKIEKLSASRPERGGLGIRPRIWEKTPAGDLVVVEPAVLPEWDVMPSPWKVAVANDLLLDWKGPKPGNVYYGFSVDVVIDDKIQGSWRSSPDLLTHPLAVESLDASELQYKLRPPRIYFETRRKFAEIRKQAVPESRAADRKAVKECAEIFAGLAERFPDWEHSEDIRSDLKWALSYLAELEK